MKSGGLVLTVSFVLVILSLALPGSTLAQQVLDGVYLIENFAGPPGVIAKPVLFWAIQSGTDVVIAILDIDIVFRFGFQWELQDKRVHVRNVQKSLPMMVV